MSDEQRVRTTAGWIGVEISRSRVRTPGKAGHGLYRVRGSVGRTWRETRELKRSAVTEDLHGERGPWTAYAFTLDDVRAAVEEAISRGTPAGPGELRVRQAYPGKQAAIVPTRWTQAYRGRRDLGVERVVIAPGQVDRRTYDLLGGKLVDLLNGGPTIPVDAKPEFVAEVSALAALVDEGLVEMTHVAGCACSGTERLTAACVQATTGSGPAPSTVRSRQREANAAFQVEHKKRRDWGLVRRHAAKARRNEA